MKMTRSARLGLLCAATAIVAAGVTSAKAEEGVAIKNLLGSIGVIPQERDPIRYRERAPLVLPPKMELREPAAAESFASSNPQWPNDPDVVARKRRAAEQSIPVFDSEVRRMNDRNDRLSIYEMREGRSAGPAVPGFHKGDNDGVWLSPYEMEKGRKTAEEKTAEDDGPPVRRTLTDPPSEMRKSARGGRITSVTADPIPDQQALDANPMNWLTRAFRKSDDD